MTQERGRGSNRVALVADGHLAVGAEPPTAFCLPCQPPFGHLHLMSGIIAIVGRPNVGKSALFNRLVGRRIAIVHDQPGVTRDRISAEAEWHGRPFSLVDTGGIGLLRRERANDVIIKAAVEQVDIAIETAQVIILVVNVQEGVVPLDREVSLRLRSCGKPVLVAANKVDHTGLEDRTAEFTALGFDTVYPVSAIHGRGMDDLMDAAMARLPALVAEPLAAVEPPSETAAEPPTETGEVPAPTVRSLPPGPLKLAIVGRPNVGKSSLVNALTDSERVIVSPVPGTTRDSVDVPFQVDTEGVREDYVLIDTAGMRKTRRVDDSIEFFSVQRAVESIERSDIVVFVLDAEAGILEQDKKIADKIIEARKACIVVVNKWDLFEEKVRVAQAEEMQARERGQRKIHSKNRPSALAEFGEWVQEKLFFLDYAPVIFTSALTGFHLDRLLEAVRYVASQLRQKIPTSLLNRTLHDAVEQRQPVSAQGLRLKFFYATQVRLSPPTFLLFVNRKELFSDQYSKYLADQMRKAFGYEGCPIVLAPKSRIQTIEPVRVRQRRAAAARSPHEKMRERRRERVRGQPTGKRKARK
jgi:GTP-binding protein